MSLSYPHVPMRSYPLQRLSFFGKTSKTNKYHGQLPVYHHHTVGLPLTKAATDKIGGLPSRPKDPVASLL